MALKLPFPNLPTVEYKALVPIILYKSDIEYIYTPLKKKHNFKVYHPQ